MLVHFHSDEPEHGDTRTIRNCSTVEECRPTTLFPEYKRELVEQTLRTDVSLAAVALANRVNTNFLARWRRDYLNAQGAAQAPALLPIHVVDIVPGAPTRPVASATAKAGEIEIRHGQTVLRIGGVPDESVLRMALQTLLQTQLDSLR